MIELSSEQLESTGYKYVLGLIEPASPYGEQAKRAIAFASPDEAAKLMAELKNVDALRHAREDAGFSADCDKLVRLFMPLKDIRRTVKHCLDAVLSEVEFFEIKRFLLQLQLIAPLANDIVLRANVEGLHFTPAVAALDILDEGGMRGATFFIPDNHSEALLRARKQKREAELKLRACEDAIEREKLNAQRVACAAEEDEEENRIRGELTEALSAHTDELMLNMDAIAALDLMLAKAELAKRGGVLPELSEGMCFKNMVNIRIEDALKKSGRRFTPVSIEAKGGASVITGANMGGKSVAMKTLALNVLLIHAGILPFAACARFIMLDGLHIVSEDLENMDRGLSSFGAEIVRFNEVIAQLGSGLHMVLLDEFARGTNPDEGAAIVRGVTEYLSGLKHISVLTTHYDGVAVYAGRHYQVMGLNGMDVEAVRGRIAAGADGVAAIAECMDYGLFEVTDGGADCPRDALNICRLLALPNDIMALIERKL